MPLLGWEQSFLGYPTSDEENAPPGGRSNYQVSYFQNGKIWWTPDSGAHAVAAQPFMTFDTGPISFDDGWAELTVSQDGSYRFRGHFHDSHPWSENDKLEFGLLSTAGILYTFDHSGHMAGTFESGSRSGDWDDSGTDPRIAAYWGDLEGCRWAWAANVNADWNCIISQVENAAGLVVGVVGIVVAK